jgi:hypothetical protein
MEFNCTQSAAKNRSSRISRSCRSSRIGARKSFGHDMLDAEIVSSPRLIGNQCFDGSRAPEENQRDPYPLTPGFWLLAPILELLQLLELLELLNG